MKAFIFPLLLFTFSVELLGSTPKKTKIKMLTWWDYIAPEVIERLKQNGYDPEIVTYRSNDVAISRLGHNQERFDVAVISNVAINILRDSLPSPKKPIAADRGYETFFGGIPKACVPYFWGTAVFAFTKGQEMGPITSIRRMVESKANGFKIGVIDDSIELAARIRSDENISGNNIFADKIFTELSSKITPKDFSSSLQQLAKEPKIATYGWLGESAGLLASRSDVDYALPSGKILIAYDAVCILNKSRMKEASGFIKDFTSRANTADTMKMVQYLSPYIDQKEGLLPPILQLRSQIFQRIAAGNYDFLEPFSIESVKDLNTWWRKIRYGQ
jgi:spermidine/putrescine-binding protein